MSFLSRFTHRGETVAIFDIAPGSVAVAIAQSTPEEPLILELCKRTTVPLSDRSTDSLESATMASLKTLAEHAWNSYTQTHPEARIQHSYVFVQAPWMTTDSFHAKHTFENEIKVDASVIRAITKEMQEQYVSRTTERPCEAAVTKISLNGYPTENPEGKRAHLVEIDALFSSCEQGLLRTIVETVRATLHTPDVSVHSSERGIVTALASHEPEGDALVVEIGAEQTNVLVIREGVGSARATLAEGVRSIVGRIAPSGAGEDTLSTLRMMSRGECATPTCQSLTEAIGKIEPEFARIVGTTLSQLSTYERLPTTLILLAPPELSGWLESFFGRIDFAPFTVTTLPFEVQVPQPTVFKKTSIAAPGVVVDQHVALYAVLVNNEILSK